MMFFFKKEKIHLDCFIDIGAIANDSPIEKSSNFLPEWWKRLPRTTEIGDFGGIKKEASTMKTCYGFTELYKKGVIVPLWSDLKIRVDNDSYHYMFAINDGNISSHSRIQYGNAFKKSFNLKIGNPWLFREKSGASFLLMEPFWNLHEKLSNIRIVPGICNFKYQYEANINCFASIEKKPYDINLQIGTPLLHVIPISEKKIEPHLHVVDEMEYNSIKNNTRSNRFLRHFSRRIKSAKEMENKNGRSSY